jgi:L-rhamnose mutarotase
VERVCFLLRMKPERLDEYRQRHRGVWEPMLAALREAGWRNYSLFLRPDTGEEQIEEIFHLD